MIGLAALLSLAIGTAAPSASDARDVRAEYDRYAQAAQMVDIGGRKLNLRCEGADRGGPTILLESGLAFSSIGWRDTQPLLARLARTCAYDRAGLGFSDPGPMPRDAAALARDLEALVDAAGLKPPFLLVGNSMGSQSLRLFAFHRPGAVAGMILLDPYVEGSLARLSAIDPALTKEAEALRAQDEACITAFRAGTLTQAQAERKGCIGTPPPGTSRAVRSVLQGQRMSRTGFEAAYAETMAFEESNDMILARETRSLGALPLIILSAQNNYSEDDYAATRAALLSAQYGLHGGLAALSSLGEVRWADASHVIQTSNPQVVAETVAEMLRSLAARQETPQ
jgi:pimeloyl-ACP methyl ester carboxylesterase